MFGTSQGPKEAMIRDALGNRAGGRGSSILAADGSFKDGHEPYPKGSPEPGKLAGFCVLDTERSLFNAGSSSI